MPRSPNTPNLKVEHVLLTYAQALFTKEALHEHLITLGPEVLLTAEETHQDGGIHFHCYFAFDRRRNINPQRFFNFEDHHPNIEAVRQNKKGARPVIDYCTKEDTSPLLFPEDHIWPWLKSSVWEQVANAANRKEALELIKANKPRDFIINRRQIDYSLDQLFPSPKVEYVSEFRNWALPPQLVSWKQEHFGKLLLVVRILFHN